MDGPPLAAYSCGGSAGIAPASRLSSDGDSPAGEPRHPFIARRRAAVKRDIKISLYGPGAIRHRRSEEHTSELQSLMRISYAVFCLKKKKKKTQETTNRS